MSSCGTSSRHARTKDRVTWRTWEAPIGALYLGADEKGICQLSMRPPEEVLAPAGKRAEEVLSRTIKELDEYFAGRRKSFDIPLSLHGTEFQKSVWAVLRGIPYGETRFYGEVAISVSRPGGARAVGMANHRNPVMILVPCHRVIGKDGNLTGYAEGLEIKEKLLALEQRYR